MEFALKVLNRYGPAPGPGSRRKHFMDEVTCAYCGGRGVDPKYSSASGCPVCRGAGRVRRLVRMPPLQAGPAGRAMAHVNVELRHRHGNRPGNIDLILRLNVIFLHRAAAIWTHLGQDRLFRAIYMIGNRSVTGRMSCASCLCAWATGWNDFRPRKSAARTSFLPASGRPCSGAGRSSGSRRAPF